LIRKFDIGAVWTTSPPPSIHWVGAQLKKKLGVRWVADFRDPWEVETPEAGSPLWSKRQKKLKVLLSTADGITTIDDEIENYLSDFAGCTPVCTIFNSYDPEDLPQAGGKKSEVFTLAYGGTLNAACNPHLFFKGLARWKKEKQVPFRLFLVGRTLGLPVEGWVEELELGENVILTGYLPHRQALLELSKADLFLLFVGMGEIYRFTLTAKIFEYIGLGRPVLAVAPPNGAVAGFLEKHPVGRLAAREEQVVGALDFYHRQWQVGKSLIISEELRNQFGWNKEAAKLAPILEGMT
jgi:glycosyltransferase involved in cell wall biosynthesis